MAAAVADAPVMTLATLRERYRHYALTIRSVSAELVRKRFIYFGRLFEFLGRPQSAGELFSKLGPRTIAAFLIDYAPHHGPGSRQDMHGALRALLRFAYEEGFMAQDLSVLVPTVRNRASAQLPRALPESCREQRTVARVMGHRS